MTYYVYIIECSDGTFYTGQTNDITRRMNQHRSGSGARYTKNRRPLSLRYVEEVESRDEALEREQEIKNKSHDGKAALCPIENEA